MSSSLNDNCSSSSSSSSTGAFLFNNCPILCSICHNSQTAEGMIVLAANKVFAADTKICHFCVEKINKISKSGVNETVSYRDWIEHTVTAEEFNQSIQMWYNTQENGLDDLLLMVMQWISAHKNSTLIPFLWEQSEKPQYVDNKKVEDDTEKKSHVKKKQKRKK